MRTGDLLGSGTISGPTVDSLGSLLEISWNGTREIVLDNGEARKFLEDGSLTMLMLGDEIIISGECSAAGVKGLGFGKCAGVILQAPLSSRKL